jgi:1-acyl-sn-glycerol-3-phosphate acyltransferase
MGRWLSTFILRLFGWHTNGSLPEGIRKAVVVSAPHTSSWDFVIGRLTFWAIRVKVVFLIKEESFVFPFGPLLKMIGGVPVARGKYKSGLIGEVTDMFERNEDLMVVITPEGTRKRVEHWKKGFYMIAMAARVPIALSYIDYGKKSGGIGPILYPSGDYEKDLAIIQNYYRNMTARHPERFNLSAKQK